MWSIDNIRLAGPDGQIVGKASTVDVTHSYESRDSALLGDITVRRIATLDDVVRVNVEFILSYDEWNLVSRVDSPDKVDSPEKMLPTFTSLKRKSLPK